MLLYLLLVSICSSLCATDFMNDKMVPVSDVEAVLGGSAQLPCNLSAPVTHDRVTLVIWYKDKVRTPIYSWDMRLTDSGEGSHWSDERQLGNRALFTADSMQAFLKLNNIKEADSGIYKCRVDFKLSPTMNSLANLTVIIPPQTLVIHDTAGLVLESDILGPLPEGSQIILTCTAKGGLPAPSVTWWLQDKLVDDSFAEDENNNIKNTYHFENLHRQHLGSQLKCLTSNTVLYPPLAKTFVIDLYLTPLEVRILGENLALSAESGYELACQSYGSRPPAVITWWKSGKILHLSTRIDTSVDSNVTTSTLMLAVLPDDNGSTLSCRASNPQIPASALEDTWTLNVLYKPIVSVDLGSNLNASFIKEGMDVYLECNVQANPKVEKVTWMRNNSAVQNNANEGTIISNQTLVLQAVSRHSSGLYSCVTENSEGDANSRPFVLDVKYEPECKRNQQRVYGAESHEEISISCEVDANPSAVWYRWRFNSTVVQSRGVETFVSDDKGSGGGTSVANYTPHSDADYGTLLCWARNELGSQRTPCVFHIVPAGKPEAPGNCSDTNRSQTWLYIKCVRGFDGGLPQHFVAEVRINGDRLVGNVTNRSFPEFTITGLEPGTDYLVSVYSTNGKGRSAHVTSVVSSTLGSTNHQHRRTPEVVLTGLEPVILLSSGVVITIILLFGIVFAIILQVHKQRRRNASDRSALHKDKTRTQLLSVALSTTTLEDERNPDVVPHKNDVDIAGVFEVQSTDTDVLPDTNVLPHWETTIQVTPPLSMHRFQQPIIPHEWGVTLWPSTTSRQTKRHGVKNAETQTAEVHKESTV